MPDPSSCPGYLRGKFRSASNVTAAALSKPLRPRRPRTGAVSVPDGQRARLKDSRLATKEESNGKKG
jgi:hypothetical protein